MELGEVGGEGRVVKQPAGEPGVEAAERPGVCPARVRADGGLGEAAGGRRRAVELGRVGGRPGRGGQSPQVGFDPRVAVLPDPDLEAIDLGLELAVRRRPGRGE